MWKNASSISIVLCDVEMQSTPITLISRGQGHLVMVTSAEYFIVLSPQKYYANANYLFQFSC